MKTDLDTAESVHSIAVSCDAVEGGGRPYLLKLVIAWQYSQFSTVAVIPPYHRPAPVFKFS